MDADNADWDVMRLADRVKNTRPRADGQEPAQDANLYKFFNNPRFGLIEMPCTMVDRNGYIMLWSLPGIMSGARVVSVLHKYD